MRRPFAPISLCVVLFMATAVGANGSGEAPHEPQRFEAAALGQDGRVTLTPGFAPDGRTIYFAQSECSPIWECPQRLKRSQWTETGWSTPELVALPSEGRVDWPSVSPDGKTLLFSWAAQRARHEGAQVDTDFDIYTLDLTAPDATPRPLDDPDINRIRGGAVRTLRFVNNETAPHLTESGDLYFWTERLDGPGERDVYVARADPSGGFQTPEPLPSPINGPQRDTLGWISPKGDLMLLTYNGRGGSGSDDLFASWKQGGRWTEPVNLGPGINSPYEDFAARLDANGTRLLFSSTRAFDGQPAGLIQVWEIAVANIPVLRAGPPSP